jgi:hypothetical protein
VQDYPSVEDLRADLVQSIETYRKDRDLVIVADFHRRDYDPATRMARIGSGSLGGKARGLAFVNRLLGDAGISDEFRGVRIFVPQSVVLGTGVFDQFMDQNDLSQFALHSTSEEETWPRASPRSRCGTCRRC